MKVDIYFDVVCPWCYIGERRFAQALDALGVSADDVEVEFRPFQLDPAAPEQAVPIAQYLERRFGAASSAMQDRVGKVAADEGITIDWSHAQMANTLNAHRLLRLAQDEYDADVQRALVEALFRAHFTDGVDVGDVAQLAAIAGSVGMDATRAAAWLSSAAGDAEVRASIREAQRIGVQSVPTFVFDGRYAVQGAQPAEAFVEVMNEVRRLGEEAAAGAGTTEG
ncbi:MAG TPA: DsbA family oxidoreductase [Longimicrobiales bacterium]